jgi:hypothetical protein
MPAVPGTEEYYSQQVLENLCKRYKALATRFNRHALTEDAVCSCPRCSHLGSYLMALFLGAQCDALKLVRAAIGEADDPWPPDKERFVQLLVRTAEALETTMELFESEAHAFWSRVVESNG